MNKLNSLALVAGFALLGAGSAFASDATPGSYKFTVGSAAPCAITLADDSQATTADDCSKIGKWKNTPGSLQLLSNSGKLVATLKENGDVYEGTRLSDGRKVVLSRDTQVGYK